MREVYKKGPWDVWKGGSFDLILTESQKTLVVSRCTHCAQRQLGHTVLATQYFRPCSEYPVTVFQYGGVSPLMFLASWLDRRSANGREGAPLFTSFQVLTDRVERRCPSSRGQATHKNDPDQPTGTFGAHWWRSRSREHGGQSTRSRRGRGTNGGRPWRSKPTSKAYKKHVQSFRS